MSELASNSSAIQWDSPLQMSDLLVLPAGEFCHMPFVKLPMLQKRTAGRAFSRVTNVTFTIVSRPGEDTAAQLCLVPDSMSGGLAPVSQEALFSCNPTILRSTPASGVSSGAAIFGTGITNVLKGTTTDVLIGKPPIIYAAAASVNVHNGEVSKDYIRVLVSYTLELFGYDWIDPNVTSLSFSSSATKIKSTDLSTPLAISSSAPRPSSSRQGPPDE